MGCSGYQLLKKREAPRKVHSDVVPEPYLALESRFHLGEGSFQLEVRKLEGTDFNIPLENAMFEFGGEMYGIPYLYSVREIESMLNSGLRLEDSCSVDKLVLICAIETHSPNGIYISAHENSFGSIWMNKIDSRGYERIFDSISEFILSLRSVPNRHQFNGDSEIEKELLFEGRYRVALLKNRTSHNGCNVVGLDVDREITWRIPADSLHTGMPYVSISERDGKLYAVNFSTIQLELDFRTGEVLGTRLLK